MEGLGHLHGLHLPANMLTIIIITIIMITMIKKLPYKFRDTWRTVAYELKDRHNWRVTFSDITNFIERQVRILKV